MDQSVDAVWEVLAQAGEGGGQGVSDVKKSIVVGFTPVMETPLTQVL